MQILKGGILCRSRARARAHVDKVSPRPVAFLPRIVLIKKPGGNARNEKSVVPTDRTHISIRYCSTVTQAVARDIMLVIYIGDIMNARLL